MDLVEKIRERALRDADESGLARCATTSEVTETERHLGFGIHPLQRRLLMEVADGGFGPGPLGIYGVRAAGRDAEMPNCLSAWRKLGGSDPSLMPAHTVPFSDLGCGCWILVDASSPSGAVRYTDSRGIFELEQGLSELLEAWANGREIHDFLYDATRAPVRKGINPFTREPIELPGQGHPLGRLILEWPEQT